MNSVEAAQARHYAYQLFSQLYLEGTTAVLLPYIQQIPDLAAALPAAGDADEAAAAHHTLFSLNLFPYESIFTQPDGMLGGAAAQRVSSAYEQAGFVLHKNSPTADHVGVELAFLAFLTASEAEAIVQEGEQGTTAVCRRRQQIRFLKNHLLRWLPSLVQAIHAQQFPFFSLLARLTLNVVVDHWQALGDAQPVDWQLPAAPQLLADEKTTLKQIAHFLVTPVHSGFYLSRDDVTRLARQQQMPRGFGGRAQMLTNLLKTAVTYEHLPAAIDALHQTACRREAAYQVLADTHPAISPFIQPWRERCRQTQRLLSQMKIDAATV